MNTSAQVMEETIKYFDGDLKRINHLIKVYGLVEADFLVNAYEDNMDKNAIESIKTKVFRTESGRRLLDMMY